MNRTQPRVSIVLPTYNGGRYIAPSIESCLHQTYSNFELLIVDGGSTDTTLDVVAGYPDPRIRVVHQPANSGRLPGALNIGFAQATGEYLTWTQDDDLFTPDAIEVMVAELEARPGIALVYGAFWFIDGDGRVTGESQIHAPVDMYWTNAVGHPFMYRRSVASVIGDYDVAYVMAEDFHYWARIYARYEIQGIPRRLYYHRLHQGSLTVQDYGRYEALRVAARARREVLGIDRLEYRRQLGEADVEEAFCAYDRGDLPHTRQCLKRGLTRDPRWLTNAGVRSLALESLIGPGLMAHLRDTTPRRWIRGSHG